jgi:four helix bundle protein
VLNAEYSDQECDKYLRPDGVIGEARFMHPKGELLRERTKAYALRVIKLVECLPNTRSAQVIGGQLLRCGTSVGANYRAACRARSPAEFCAKLGIVEEEADESVYWMELLVDSSVMEPRLLENLMQEGHEILFMVVASIQTSRRKNARETRPKT